MLLFSTFFDAFRHVSTVVDRIRGLRVEGGGLLRHPPGERRLTERRKEEGEGRKTPYLQGFPGDLHIVQKRSIKCLEIVQKLWYYRDNPKERSKDMEFLKYEERRRGGRPGITELDKDKVVQMYRNNMSIAMIVSNTGISRSSVYKILKERTEKANGKE